MNPYYLLIPSLNHSNIEKKTKGTLSQGIADKTHQPKWVLEVLIRVFPQ